VVEDERTVEAARLDASLDDGCELADQGQYPAVLVLRVLGPKADRGFAREVLAPFERPWVKVCPLRRTRDRRRARKRCRREPRCACRAGERGRVILRVDRDAH
jgi:hypothetical protein